MIKHNSPSSVLSPFNPIASLKPKMRKLVNENFIYPILERFFFGKGGVNLYCALDSDKLVTEIEFEKAENFVKTYIYKDIIDQIEKKGKSVIFKPKYVITFDKDLTDFQEENSVKFGTIHLGNTPILYYIYIELQDLIRFIKTQPAEIIEIIEEDKILETEEEKRNNLVDMVILNKTKLLDSTEQPQIRGEILKEIKSLKILKSKELQGQSGKLRINLTWNTTDDLDLHILTPNGEIAYNTPNKTIEHNGVFGVLDLDRNAGSEVISNPQENINFNAMPFGLHTVFVYFYTKRENEEVAFTVTILPEHGEGRIFNKTVKGKGCKTNITTFEFLNDILVFGDIT